MIDTLVALRERIAAVDAPRRHGLRAAEYLVVTLHRPALVDGPLLGIAIDELRRVAAEIPVIFPTHPRTRARLRSSGIEAPDERLHIVPPLGYLEFMGLVSSAAGVVTDSGGIQEETTYLGDPLLHAAQHHRTAGHGRARHEHAAWPRARADRRDPGPFAPIESHPRRVPPLWDGHAAERLVEILAEDFESERVEVPA